MRKKCTVQSLIESNRHMKLSCGNYIVIVSSSDVQRFIDADPYNCAEILGYVFDASGNYYLQVMRMAHRIPDVCGTLIFDDGCYAAMVM